jgi:TolB-like protein
MAAAGNLRYELAEGGYHHAVSARDIEDPVPEPVRRAHLEKVARSVTFSRAEQLRQLLAWLGERSLRPVAVPPSEKEIAVSVLKRQDFDPQADSLVRKEMSRLREKLSRYYQSEGREDEVRVSADSGYLLGFKRLSYKSLANGRPCWLILPFRSNADLSEQAERLLEEMMIRLTEEAGPLLVAPTTALGYCGRRGDVRQFAAECHADFVGEGSLRRKDALVDVTIWLVDGRSGHAQRSTRIQGTDAAELAQPAVAWLLEDAAEGENS